MVLEGYLDFEWGECADTRRFVAGYVIKMGGMPIVWKSKKQTILLCSLAKAEYRALGSIVAEITWLVGLLKDLKVENPLPIPIHYDSKGAIQTASNLVFHE